MRSVIAEEQDAMSCKLCGEDRKLVKSHIIPKAFFEATSGGLAMMFDREDLHPKRMPNGIYDAEILCDQCEQLFGEWDDYAFNLLIHKASERQRREQDGITYEVLANYDYNKLKLFFMSVLLRADLSEDDFWQRISLGKRRMTLYKHILRRRAPGRDVFPVYLSRMSTSDRYAFYFPPEIESSAGKSYCFYMGRFSFTIRADRGGPPSDAGRVILTPGKALIIPVMPVEGSDMARVVRTVLDNPTNRKLLERRRPAALDPPKKAITTACSRPR